MIKPLGDRVLLRRLPATNELDFGLVLPDDQVSKSTEGIVLAISEYLDTELMIGDEVCFKDYAGYEVKDNGEEVLIIGEPEILAKVIDDE